MKDVILSIYLSYLLCLSIYCVCLSIPPQLRPTGFTNEHILDTSYVQMVFAGYIFIVRYTLLGKGFEANKLLSGSPKFLCLLDILIGLSFSVWTQLHFPLDLPYRINNTPSLSLPYTAPILLNWVEMTQGRNNSPT